MERWSVIPSEFSDGKIGWTLNSKSTAELIFFTFEDLPRVYLYPFQPLRVAFSRYKDVWSRRYKTDVQHSRNDSGSRWKSQCVFVPADVVWAVIGEVCNPAQLRGIVA